MRGRLGTEQSGGPPGVRPSLPVCAICSLRGAGCPRVTGERTCLSCAAVSGRRPFRMSTSDPRNATDRVDPLGETLVPANQTGLPPTSATGAPPQAVMPLQATLQERGRAAVSAEGGSSCPPGYEVMRERGRGGMGVVYLARQVKAERLVALTMIRSGVHAEAGEVARFHAEAAAIARLQHP